MPRPDAGAVRRQIIAICARALQAPIIRKKPAGPVKRRKRQHTIRSGRVGLAPPDRLSIAVERRR